MPVAASASSQGKLARVRRGTPPSSRAVRKTRKAEARAKRKNAAENGPMCLDRMRPATQVPPQSTAEPTSLQ
ncbi:hypothetical protein DSECCO2_651700 [anaerobic digester metagenome]